MSTPAPRLTWGDLEKKVDLEGGSWITTVATLKAIATGTSTGRRTNETLTRLISDELDKRRLSHWPAPLPLRQDATVWVYRSSTLGGEVLSLVNLNEELNEGDVALLAEAVRILNKAQEETEAQRMAALDEKPRRRRKS